MTSEFAFDIEGLSKSYRIRARQWNGRFQPAPHTVEGDLFWALRDVSVQIRHGETVGILGRNGAGKSTLLRILSSVTDPSLGTVRVTGRVGSLLEVGAGFQPDLTGRDNVMLVGAILGMRRRETLAVFDRIVEFSGVGDFIDVPVKRYSSGMYLRLAFSVAAHLRAENLLIDEALAVGDQAFREKCIDKLRELAAGGRTVLFVSHDASSILKLCERALVFEHGRMVADDRVADALAVYSGLLAPPHEGYEVGDTDPGRPQIVRAARVDDARPDERGEHRIGQRVDFDIDVAIPSHWPTDRLRLLVEVIGADQWPVTGSEYSLAGAVAGSHRLRCSFPELKVSPGRYSFTVKLVEDGSILESIAQLHPFGVDGAGRLGPTWTWRYVEDADWTASRTDPAGAR